MEKRQVVIQAYRSGEVKIQAFGSVKTLINQFEKINTMGAEQSYSSNLSSNRTKQYECQQDVFEKRSTNKRRFSAHEKRLKSYASESSLQRSVSVDHSNKKHYIKDDNYIDEPHLLSNVRDDTIDIQTARILPEPQEVIEQEVSSEDSSVYESDVDNNSEKYKLSTATSVKNLMTELEEKLASNLKALKIKSSSETNLSNDYIKENENTEKDASGNKNLNDTFAIDERVSYTENEFQQIEESLKEVEDNIKEMQEQQQHHNTTNKSDYSNKTDSIECINIFLTHQNDDFENSPEDGDDDEFGQRTLGNHDNVDFVEAFNRLGDELIITTASIERKSIYVDEITENQISIKLKNEEDLPFDRGSLNSDYEGSANEGDVNSIRCEGTTESNSDTRPSSDDEHCTPDTIRSRIHLISDYDRAVRAETIYDSFQNPRIEKVSNIDTIYLPENTPQDVTDSKVFVADPSSDSDIKKKKDYIIEELIQTEKAYLKHLEMVVFNYMPAFRSDKLPVFLRGSCYIFGNIKHIYSKSRKFYKSLKRCGNSAEEVAKTFILFEELFELYPLYSKNKPTADYFLMGQLRELVLVKEKMLHDRLGLASHLLTPVQRLGKYILFLEQIQKEIIKTQGVSSKNVHKAIAIVRKQMSRGNDFIAIDSIKDSLIDLAKHAGSFLMREKFMVLKPKRFEAMLFLFENVLVFTTVDAKNAELFVYKDSIQLTEMGIITFEDSPLSFHLRRFHSSKKSTKVNQEYIIEAKRAKDKKLWTDEIEKRLWEQLVKCKEQQNALQIKYAKRNTTAENSNRVKSKKVSYNSLPGELRKSRRRSIFYDEPDD